MKHLFKKVGLFFLNLLRPVFEFISKRRQDYFGRLRSSFTDPYLCGMVSRFNLLHEWMFKPYFEKVKADPEELQKIKRLSGRATLVYVMKNRGQLEYSYFNHCFLKEKIPLARFANGCRTLFWRPFVEMFKSVLARWHAYYEDGFLEDPIQSGYLENLVANGQSALLNLKVSRELIFGTSESSLEFIAPLLRAAEKSKRPVYLITQQFLYDRHPERVEKSWLDLLFGEKSNPGMFRKIVLFLLIYRRRATVKFGEPLDLKNFIKENSKDEQEEVASKLNAILLIRLQVERKSITGPALQPREKLLEKILRNKGFKAELEALREKQSRTKAEMQKEVSKYFTEIAASVHYSYIDFYDRLIYWISNHVFDGLDIDTQGLAKIKSIAGKHPIVLVPAHKSHIDYLLLSYIFYNYDLTLPHICAGINLKFWPVSGFIRRGGGFFIRRSLGDNQVYKLVMQHYLELLVKEGYSIEFFIEGTRSRTGKLLKPKLGVLSMLMRAYLKGVARDLYFVPVAINYERIMEEKSYVSEIAGSKKQKENVRGILKAGKKFRKKYGKVFIRFADPVSLKAFISEKENKALIKKEGDRRLVEDFGYRLTYHINRVSVVTSTSLVSTALLSQPKKGITKKDLLWRVEQLQNYLEYKEAQLSNVIQADPKRAYGESIQRLCRDNQVAEHEDFHEKFYTVEESRRSILDYQKNNSLHFFVSLVCLSKLLETSPENSLSLEMIEKRYEMLKKLLEQDFTFSQRTSLREHLLKVIIFYDREGILTYDESLETVTMGDGRKHPVFRFYASLCNNFFESYYLTLMYLKNVPFEKEDRKKLVAHISERGRLFYLKGDLCYPEALSQFNIRNALSVFKSLGLIKLDDKGLFYRLFDEESCALWEELLTSLVGLGQLPQSATTVSFLGNLKTIEEKTSQDLH